jgi:hypothetical protein
MAKVYTETERAITLLANRRDKLILQEFTNSYLYYRMIRSGNTINIPSESLEVPMYLGSPSNGTWWNTGDVLPDGVSGRNAMGYWTNRFCVVPCSWDEFEQWKLEGDPSVIFDQMAIREMEMVWAMAKLLANGMWNGTGNKMPDGITYAIEKRAIGSQIRTISGIDKSTKMWYNNAYVQLANNFGYTPPNSRIPAGLAKFMELQTATTIGAMACSDFITTKSIFNMFRKAMIEVSSAFTMMQSRDSAEYGFENFQVDGSTLAWDSYCPADSIYALSLQDVRQQFRLGDKRNKQSYDADFEELPKKSFIEIGGSMAIARHPRIRNRAIQPRNAVRRMLMSKWIMESFNLVYSRMQNLGVAGSDNGSRWSTW